MGAGIAPTIFDAVSAAAARHGRRPFLVIGRRDEVLDFQTLADQADAFGRLLWQQGARPGDRVGIWMTNHVEWPVAAFGAARVGCIAVGISTRLTGREAAHLLALSQARFLVMEDTFRGRIDALPILQDALDDLRGRGMAPPRIILCRRGSHAAPADALDWTEAMPTARDLPDLPPAAELVGRMGAQGQPELAGVAAILSTSGTTGAPKGVMLTHDGLLRLAEACGRRQDLGPDERFYSIAPFFHCSGLMHGLLTCLLAGSTYFSPNAYDAEETWAVLTDERITAYHGFIEPLQDIADNRSRDLSRLAAFDRAWFSAAAERMETLEARLGVRMCEVYGLTETGGNVAICTAADPAPMRYDSDGRPHDGLEVRIVDPETGAERPEGTPGEIRLRGWNVMRGYFGDPEATRRAIDPDGWLSTGDQGVALPGGYVKFVSRLKDVIRVGGENLAPMEVEEVLLGHPAVLEAAVVAAPDPRLVEVPVAFLRLRPGQAAEPDDLADYCRTRLANFKRPRRFVVLDDFPRTGATNRIQKAQLRAMLATGAGDAG